MQSRRRKGPSADPMRGLEASRLKFGVRATSPTRNFHYAMMRTSMSEKQGNILLQESVLEEKHKTSYGVYNQDKSLARRA